MSTPSKYAVDFVDMLNSARGSIDFAKGTSQKGIYGRTYHYSIDPGLVVDRIVEQYRLINIPTGNPESVYSDRRVFCFVLRSNGDVIKPAGWKAPAKSTKGHYMTEWNLDNDFGLLSEYCSSTESPSFYKGARKSYEDYRRLTLNK